MWERNWKARSSSYFRAIKRVVLTSKKRNYATLYIGYPINLWWLKLMFAISSTDCA